jgi:HAD superfamily hydrolase (TIGR01509 family)
MTVVGGISALVLDFDGTVCDSERLWAEILAEAYGEASVVFPRDRFVAGIGGTAADFDPFADLAAAAGLDRDTLEATCHRRYDDRVTREAPLPGVVELCRSAHEAGMKLAIASNADPRDVNAFLRQSGLAALFGATVTRTPGARPKPAPDLYLGALAALGCPPAEALAFEDSARGVRAARDAGLRCVAVPTALTATHDLSAADWIVPDLTHVSPSRAGVHLRLASPRSSRVPA